MEIAEPRRTNPRSDSELPTFTKSSVDKLEPNFETPYIEIEDPSLAKERSESADPNIK
jgi:hypothetical protein